MRNVGCPIRWRCWVGSVALPGCSGLTAHMNVAANVGRALLLLAIAGTLTGCASSRVEAPSRRMMIAMMPPDTESIALWDFPRLLASDSILKQPVRDYLESWMSGPADGDDNDLRTAARRKIVAAGPVAHALGGSQFAPAMSRDGVSPAIGAGQFVERSIWVLRDPFAANDLIAGRNDVACLHASGLTIYTAEITVHPSPETDPEHKPFFLAVPTPHTVVWAESQAEVEYMARVLRARDSKLPERWADLLDERVADAPFLVLRHYDRTNADDLYSPVSSRRPDEWRVDIRAGVAALMTASEPRLELKLLTPDPPRAQRYMTAWLFSDEAFVWDATAEPWGLRASLSPHVGREQQLRDDVLLIGLLFWGLNALI
jgi:hypothetical protein